MTTPRRVVATIIALSVAGAACAPTEAVGPKAIGEHQREPSTTTTSPPPPPPDPTFVIDVVMDADPGTLAAVGAMYAWIGDRSLPEPDVPAGLLAVLEPVRPEDHMTVQAHLHSSDLGDEGRVGVVIADDDVVLIADEGEGWRVVGASLPRFGLDPWYGEPIRHVLIIGTDARRGQSQPLFRADAISIVASNLEQRAGGIVGIPRDAHVQASYGMDKFSSVNARSDRHADEMLEIATDLSGLPLEGYLLTGFVGFIDLVDQFGGVMINVPYRMNDWRAEADLYAGLQRLMGRNALAFSRIRSIPGGDFTRSANRGVVIVAALAEIAQQDITRLPALLSILVRNTWTDMALGDLLTLAAVGFEIDPGNVHRTVLPGSVRTIAGASVVVLDEERSEAIFRDLDDGVLTPAG